MYADGGSETSGLLILTSGSLLVGKDDLVTVLDEYRLAEGAFLRAGGREDLSRGDGSVFSCSGTANLMKIGLNFLISEM